MNCPECHTELPDDAQFCNKCGGKVELTCPGCGRANPPDSNFCLKCGHDLRKPEESPRIDYNEPQSYTPKFLAEKILTSRSAIEGERKLVTVLFADVAGFTPMSEKLDPEDVHEVMDGCFRILMDEIHRFEGTVNEFRGDGLMALFGAPIAHEDHAVRACHASLAIQKALLPYAEKLHKHHGVDFKMRIGLNSGPVVVGAIGDDLRMDYTAQGDTANLAARMESNAEPGGVLVSKHTYWLARDFFQFQAKGPLQVKGKAEPVKAYRLVKAGEIETRIEAAAGRGFTRFVGRKREIETLKEAFEKAQAGEGQVVGIVGDAGVGKSRILHEFRSLLPLGRHTYLEGRCLHYGSFMPYLPIIDVFRSFVGIKEGDDESEIKNKMAEKTLRVGEDLRMTIPPFQDLLSLKVDDEAYVILEPAQKKERIFEAVRDLFVRGSQNVPIVLAVEDLHWMDKATEELLAYLIEWIPSTRMLLILLYRPEYTHQWGSKSYYSKIGVDQLSDNTSAELVQAILEGGSIEPELREFILGRTAGNPLFMEELTHSLIENGSVAKEDERYVLAANLSDIDVPDTIQGIIASRMDRLEENLKRLLQVASVIGRAFFFRILQAITEMQEDLKGNLLKLQGLEFIYEKRLFPELEYIFKHALTQEVAYKSLLLKRRKGIHGRIGEAVEGVFRHRLEEFYEVLAYHYSKSGNKEKACHYLNLSGNKAARNESLWEAFRFFRQALEILEAEPETDDNIMERSKVILSMAPSMRALGYPDDSEDILRRGEKLAIDLGDSRIISSMYGWTGMYHMQTGSPILAMQYQETAYEEAYKTGDVHIIAPAAWQLCVSYASIQHNPRVFEVTRKIIPLIDQNHARYDSFGTPIIVYPILLGMHACAIGFQGNFVECRRLLNQALAVTKERNQLYSLGFLLWWLAFAYSFQGNAENGIKYSLESIRCFEDSQGILFLPLALATCGYAHYLANDLDEARRQVEKGLQLQQQLGTMFWFSLHHFYLAQIHMALGDFDRGRALGEEAVAISVKIKARMLEGQSKALLGKVMARIDESKANESESLVVEGIKILQELKVRPAIAVAFLYLGEVFADSGQRNKAPEIIKKAETMFRDMEMDYWLGKTREVLHRL